MSLFDWFFGPSLEWPAESYGPYAQMNYQGDPYAGTKHAGGFSQGAYDAYVREYNTNAVQPKAHDPNVIDVEAKIIDEEPMKMLDINSRT